LWGDAGILSVGAVIAGRALWCSPRFTRRLGLQRFHCLTLSLNSDVRVVLKHIFRDVPRQVPYNFISGTALGDISNKRMAIVMEAALIFALARALRHAVFSDVAGA
jgi:hypothetical protein